MLLTLSRRLFGGEVLTLPCAGCGEPALTIKLMDPIGSPVRGTFRHVGCEAVKAAQPDPSPLLAWATELCEPGDICRCRPGKPCHGPNDPCFCGPAPVDFEPDAELLNAAPF